ncbi:hypothetical protein Hanom_Chr12g01077591 [Helianthus anomalus]
MPNSRHLTYILRLKNNRCRLIKNVIFLPSIKNDLHRTHKHCFHAMTQNHNSYRQKRTLNSSLCSNTTLFDDGRSI